LESAAAELGKILKDLRLSSMYRSAPLHVTGQPFFFNTAAAGFFNFGAGERVEAAGELLKTLQFIEAAHGRDRSAERRWGERTLDIDILLFGDTVLQTPVLIIPHPRLAERRFALEPLLELLPDAQEPGTGRFYRDLLTALADQEVRRVNPPEKF
jgi:2-amino-4-hydroxy-6-hydroxymethyldihydropteridine diphosphokinase